MQTIDRAKEFAKKMLGFYTGAVLTKLIQIGYETGLFEAAARGPATSGELAERAGLQERYVREWLGAMTTGGVFEYDAATRRYALPEDYARYLTGSGYRNAAPMSAIINHFGKHVPQLVKCFQEGGGIPYADFRPDFTANMDDSWRRIYDELLIHGFLDKVPGLIERLAAGDRVLDVGCGTGHAINLMAREFPRSTFVGYDLAGDAIAAAQGEAERMGLANASFASLDVSELPASAKYGVITAFDAIHDQVDPAAVLAGVYQTLDEGGIFLMIDFKFASDVAANVNNPYAAMYYGISLMHCMTVSLAHDGAGLGTVWGIEKAREMLAQAGFTSVEVLDSPRPQNCMYVCRK